MAKDVRALREEAAQSAAAGKHKRALAAYLELERLEPQDSQWAKRAGETYKRLGNNALAIQAFNRSVERYAQNGFLVQAIAVCKLVLQIDPNHADTLRRLAEMNQQVGAGPTRSAVMAENNPGLHENPNVAAIRRASTGSVAGIRRDEIDDYRRGPSTYGSPSSKKPTDPIAIARTKSTKLQNDGMPVVSRTKSKPITLAPGAPLGSVTLAKEVPDSQVSAPGIHVIPIDDGFDDEGFHDADDRQSAPIVIAIEPDGNTYDAEVEEIA
nr:tetratricopeptide repeat protein [Deltaproteobacteria bacterium]